MSVVSTIFGPPISTGFLLGCCLAVARPAVGSAPNLLQDFTCTIGGAFLGEIIGGGGTFLFMKNAAKGDRSVGFAIGLATIIGGTTGIVIGANIGAITSIALSILNR